VLAFSGFGCYRDQLLDYEGDRLSRVDLVCGRFAELRLDVVSMFLSTSRFDCSRAATSSAPRSASAPVSAARAKRKSHA
jgi:hypothetical protein